MTIQSRMLQITPYIDRPKSDYVGKSFDGTNALSGYRDSQPYISTPSRARQQQKWELNFHDWTEDPVQSISMRGTQQSIPVLSGVAASLVQSAIGIGADSNAAVCYGPVEGFDWKDLCFGIVGTMKAVFAPASGSWMIHNFAAADNEVQLGFVFSEPQRPLWIAGDQLGLQGDFNNDRYVLNEPFILTTSFDGDTINRMQLNGGIVRTTPASGNDNPAILDAAGLDLMSNENLTVPSDNIFQAFYFRKASEISVEELNAELNQIWNVY